MTTSSTSNPSPNVPSKYESIAHESVRVLATSIGFLGGVLIATGAHRMGAPVESQDVIVGTANGLGIGAIYKDDIRNAFVKLKENSKLGAVSSVLGATVLSTVAGIAAEKLGLRVDPLFFTSTTLAASAIVTSPVLGR